MPEPRPLRILIIWGESIARPSAGTVHCAGLARGFMELGHSVRIITPQYRGQKQFLDDLDIHPIRLPRRGFASFLLFQIITIISLPLWLMKERPDVIYVRTCFLQWLLALESRLLGTPLVGEVDGLVDQEVLVRGAPRIAAWLFRCNEKLAAKCSSGLVCVSRALREEYVRHRWANPATTVGIHNGATPAVMRPHDQTLMRREHDLAQDDVIFGFAGSLAPWQGLDFFVTAAGLVCDKDTDKRITFAIMGRGALEDSFRKQVDDAGLADRFHFFPPGDGGAVARFLSACDAVVLPRNDRRFIGLCSPLKFFDGISVGLPVIVPERSEVDEILDRLGLPGTFDPDSVESLCDAMIAVADRVDDFRPRRQEIHDIVAADYSWSNVAEKTVELFRQLTPHAHG